MVTVTATMSGTMATTATTKDTFMIGCSDSDCGEAVGSVIVEFNYSYRHNYNYSYHYKYKVIPGSQIRCYTWCWD